MEQSPFLWVNMFSGNQEMPRILWNPKVHYCIQTIRPYPEPEQSSPCHLTPLLEDSFSYYSPIYARSSKKSLSLRFPNRNSVLQLSCPPCVPHAPSNHSSWFYHPNNIWWGVHSIKLLLHSPITSSLLRSNIFLNTLFKNTLILFQ